MIVTSDLTFAATASSVKNVVMTVPFPGARTSRLICCDVASPNASKTAWIESPEISLILATTSGSRYYSILVSGRKTRRNVTHIDSNICAKAFEEFVVMRRCNSNYFVVGKGRKLDCSLAHDSASSIDKDLKTSIIGSKEKLYCSPRCCP